MSGNIVGAIITFVLGFAVAGLNFLLSKAILTKQPDKYAFSTILRQLIQVLYIVAVYFVAEKTPWDMMYMLVGAVLGVTLPMFFFTQRLVKINDTMIKNRKEGDDNG